MASGLFHLPDAVGEGVRVFKPSASNGGAWFSWSKPRGCRLVMLWGCGPGGTGGRGYSGASGGGGGGGGSGGVSSLIIPAWLVPDMLWVLPAAGGSGLQTFVAVSPVMPGGSAPSNVLLIAAAGSNGTNGSSGSSGGGGSGGNAQYGSGWALWAVGVSAGYTGQSGANGGNQAAGSAITPGNSTVVTGGSGGAGHAVSTNYAGGVITAPQAGWEPMVANVAGGVGAGGNGRPGLDGFHRTGVPSYSTGGTGGGSNYGATGGNGGRGGTGSGGGGGGSGSTGGSGGLGGDGLVVITAI